MDFPPYWSAVYYYSNSTNCLLMISAAISNQYHSSSTDCRLFSLCIIGGNPIPLFKACYPCVCGGAPNTHSWPWSAAACVLCNHNHSQIMHYCHLCSIEWTWWFFFCGVVGSMVDFVKVWCCAGVLVVVMSRLWDVCPHCNLITDQKCHPLSLTCDLITRLINNSSYPSFSISLSLHLLNRLLNVVIQSQIASLLPA